MKVIVPDRALISPARQTSAMNWYVTRLVRSVTNGWTVWSGTTGTSGTGAASPGAGP